MTALRRGLATALMVLAAAGACAAESVRSPAEIGEAIYRFGILGSGQPLRAVREGGGTGAAGVAAACVNCHQRSGLGSAHPSLGGIGARAPDTQIPPIAWHYLFDPVSPGHEHANLPYVDGMRNHPTAYSGESLARALREGIDVSGRKLGYLMPRFAIGDDDVAALAAYLKTLDPTRVPGVTGTTLHFATIITPDVDPARRKAMLDVMGQFFAERNVRQMTPSPTMQVTNKGQFARAMFMVHRQWTLHVWDLTGPSSDWGRQLDARFAKEPVLAVVSGLGRATWAPVHQFCERQHLACLFPNVEVPVDASSDFFELYLSRGVLLEADLIAEAIKGAATKSAAATSNAVRAKSVRQIYRTGDSGEAASHELATRLKAQGIDVTETAVPGDTADLAQAVGAGSGSDALVLWLRPADLDLLGDVQKAPSTVYMSGLMGGLERAPLPRSWRSRTHMAYPFDLPSQRVVRVDFPMGWFKLRRIPVVDEQMQADTYLVCGLVSEAIKEVGGTFYGPYLIEELQVMLAHRFITGYYPRLSLAENQHFASKGGYVVHFADAQGTQLVADSDWNVP